MSIEKAIEVGEKAVQELEAKKEAERLAKLSPEEKQAEAEKAKATAKAAEDQKILDSKDEELDEATKAKKQALIEAKEKEAQAEEARILQAKEEELSEEERATKEILLAEKLEVEKARKEAKTNARIDEIMGELKAERNERIKDQERMRALESELNALKNPTTEDAIERKEAERIAKYTAEDKKLPREKRREMDNSELEEWLMEDIVAAQRWLANQTLRRDRERQADLTPKDDAKAKADAVIRKQEQSKARVALKHPELDVTKRVAELREQGKTQADIQATIFKENPKARIVAEIMQENPDKYILHENGPELLAEEMERRLKTAPKKQVNQEDLDAEVEARVQAELRRRESLPENIRSNRDGGPEKKLNDLEKVQWVTFKKMFPQKTFADFESMQKRREKVA